MAESRRVVVVGGGIAGLVAASYAARAGARVELIEAISALGGRARTRNDAGFLFNMGPHALYLGSAAKPILDELGVTVSGNKPPASGGLVRRKGRLHAFPGGLVSLLTTGAIGIASKIELGAFLAKLAALDTSKFAGVPLEVALRELLRHAESRELVCALVRLTSYTHAPAMQCAASALSQLQAGFADGVLYMDGGWQTMVDGLVAAAARAGAHTRGGARVTAVCAGAVEVDGETVPADAIVLAMGPREASSIVDGGGNKRLQSHAERSIPVRAACLDLGLSRLPFPRKAFCLGMDEPLYASVHSTAAKLAPPGGALLQIARYLAPDEKPERRALEVQLEGFLDQLQPGWREFVVAKKLLTDLRVAHALIPAEGGGLAGRPSVAVADHPGLYLAGDWVGDTGQLADAAFASGREAGLAAARAEAG